MRAGGVAEEEEPVGPSQVQNLQGRLAGLRTRPQHPASPPVPGRGYPQGASFILLRIIRW